MKYPVLREVNNATIMLLYEQLFVLLNLKDKDIFTKDRVIPK